MLPLGRERLHVYDRTYRKLFTHLLPVDQYLGSAYL